MAQGPRPAGDGAGIYRVLCTEYAGHVVSTAAWLRGNGVDSSSAHGSRISCCHQDGTLVWRSATFSSGCPGEPGSWLPPWHEPLKPLSLPAKSPSPQPWLPRCRKGMTARCHPPKEATGQGRQEVRCEKISRPRGREQGEREMTSARPTRYVIEGPACEP